MKIILNQADFEMCMYRLSLESSLLEEYRTSFENAAKTLSDKWIGSSNTAFNNYVDCVRAVMIDCYRELEMCNLNALATLRAFQLQDESLAKDFTK